MCLVQKWERGLLRQWQPGSERLRTVPLSVTSSKLASVARCVVAVQHALGRPFVRGSAGRPIGLIISAELSHYRGGWLRFTKQESSMVFSMASADAWEHPPHLCTVIAYQAAGDRTLTRCHYFVQRCRKGISGLATSRPDDRDGRFNNQASELRLVSY